VRTNADNASRKWANIVADTGNDPAAQEPLPSEGAEISSDPAALPAAEKAIDSEINEGAREAADEPIPAPPLPLHPLAAAIVPMRDDASIRESARLIGPNDPIDPIIRYEGKILDRWDLYLACLLAKREPTFETYTGNDPVRFLIDRQLNRGYPNESQRAMLGARVCVLPVGGEPVLGGSVNWQSLGVAQRQPKVHFPRQEGPRARNPGTGQSR
jgi:hypothetical protein